MKSKVLVYLFFCFFILTSVFAINFNSATPTDHYSTSVNYETITFDGGVLDATSEFTTSIRSGGRTPIVCDIDSDGIREYITYNGNTITIIHLDETGFSLEKSFALSPVSLSVDTTINWISCGYSNSDELILGTNKPYLSVHQGITDGQSEVSFIGHNPNLGNTVDARIIDYGDDYVKMGGLLNVSRTFNGVSCDSYRAGSQDLLTGACAFSNQKNITYFRFVPLLVGQNPNVWETYSTYDDGTFTQFPATTLGASYNIMNAGIGTASNIALMFDASNTPNFYYGMTWSALDNNIFHAVGDTSTQTLSITPSQSLIHFQNERLGAFSVAVSDINGDGYKDACFYGELAPSAQDSFATLWCGTTSGTELLDTRRYSTGDDQRFYAIGFYDFTGNGDKEIVANVWSDDNALNDLNVYLTDSGYTFPANVKSEQTNPFYTMAIVRNDDNQNETFILAGEYYFVVDTTNPTVTITEDVAITGNQVYDMVLLTDFNYDYSTETVYIDRATGTTKLYYHDELPLFQSITLRNDTRYADGYFGFDPKSCVDTPITIKATECADDESTVSCTYENTIEFERERLCTTCGGTVPLFCGDWSYASPEVSCTFALAGDKALQVYIETESKVGLTQGVGAFVVEVTNDLTCNQNVLSLPATFIDPDAPPPTNGGGDGEEPDSEKSQLELYYDDWLDTLDESVPRPIQLIASIVIMISMAVYMHNATNGNNYLTILGSLFGAGISVALGLLAIELVLIVGVGLLIFVFVAYKFDSMGSRT